uniref:Uncharacterized protein n=1 Tax=Arundo donax TaxID=35708 RepID=A0A0A9H4L2_ARUDO
MHRTVVIKMKDLTLNCRKS